MKHYRYTDKLLFILAIGNLLLIIPLFWAFWMPLQMALGPHQGDASTFLFNILVYGIAIELIILCATAWAFFKRWRLVLFAYVLYAAYMLPGFIQDIVYYAKHPQFNSNFYFPGKFHTWAYTTLLIFTLIAFIVFIAETLIGKMRGYNTSALLKS